MVQQKIREYMIAKGIKFKKVIEDTGISQSTFSAIINGQRNLKADEFFAICKSLEVSPEIFQPEVAELAI
jgi:transcriptional regulator with XRE-family HTH domain